MWKVLKFYLKIFSFEEIVIAVFEYDFWYIFKSFEFLILFLNIALHLRNIKLLKKNSCFPENMLFLIEINVFVIENEIYVLYFVFNLTE